jgi:hypothetical protein
MKTALITAILAAALAGYAYAQQDVMTAPLDSGVNALLQAAGAPNEGATKVVPIITTGGAKAGFAQIVGSQENVARTHAVVEIRSHFGGAWDVRALVAVSSVSRGGTVHRENGVAVDAVIAGGF